MPEPTVERIREIADRLERDRREPDKVLCYVQDLRRLATATERLNELAARGSS